jgi:hypothetical protein
MLYKYHDFNENLILERLINESIFYYSPDVRRILVKLSKENAIAKDIISIEAEDIKPDITFIDLDKEGYISFSTMRNAKKIIMDKYPTMDYVDTNPDVDLADELWSLDKKGSDRGTGLFLKSRNPLAIGRFVNKLFPGKYSDKEREEFVNLFKSSIEQTGEKFEIVEGDQIPFWYDYNNYKEVSGNLGNSCMREKPALVFEMYSKNPDLCKMVVLLEDGKLIGRALIWKITSYKKNGRVYEGPEWFMDRQYTIKESDVAKFRKFADDKGWGYKTNNNHHSFQSMTYKGESIGVYMKIQLPKNGTTYGYKRYPYMDTFRRFDIDNGTLHNDDEEDNDGHYLLDDTDGGYSQTSSGVWSDYHGENIPEDRAVWSDYENTYLWDNRCVEVTRGSRRNRGYYPEDCDVIVHSEWYDDYLHEDDSVYSEAYGDRILEEDAKKVIDNIYSDGSIEPHDEASWYHEDDDEVLYMGSKILDRPWAEILSNRFSDWSDYQYIHDSLLEKDYKGEWILKKFKIETFKVLDASNNPNPVDLEGVEYLKEEDAIAFGWEVDTSEKRVTDLFDYHKEIEDLLETLEKRLSSKINHYNRVLNDDTSGELPLKFDKKMIEKGKETAKKSLNKLVKRLEQVESGEFLPN